MNDYFYALAQNARNAAIDRGGLENIDARWIYCQWYHESEGFGSELACCNNNLAGLTQEKRNDTGQPDGSCYYIKFKSLEECAIYYGHYVCYFVENGIDKATSLAEYLTALKEGGYFGDNLDTYIADCQNIYEENFGGN